MRTVLRFVGLAAAGFVVWLLAVWPPPVWYRDHWPRETAFMAMRLTDSRGAAIAYRPVPLDSIARPMREAVVIGEDGRFYSHWGIDYLELARALGYQRRELDWSDPRDRAAFFRVLPQAWAHRDRLRGASTITQQLAKNLYLSPSRNPFRKLKEAVTAWRLEAALGKARILELYLNVVELGDGVWGVEAASRRYFHRDAAALDSEQAAALAGTLPFPRSSNPAHRPARMRWRQNLILRRMRGEWVEVPPEEGEDEIPAAPVPAGDTVPALPDSFLLQVDTTAPRPDSLARPLPDSMAPADTGVEPDSR
jgi:monofunctional glycosyltransferase